MAVTVKLKPGLKWGDGVPVTTRDLAFTWKVGARPGLRLRRTPHLAAAWTASR